MRNKEIEKRQREEEDEAEVDSDHPAQVAELVVSLDAHESK